MNLSSVVLNIIVATFLIIPLTIAIVFCSSHCLSILLEIQEIHTAIETMRSFEHRCKNKPSLEELKQSFTQRISEYPCINNNDVIYGIELELKNYTRIYLVGISQ